MFYKLYNYSSAEKEQLEAVTGVFQKDVLQQAFSTTFALERSLTLALWN